MREHFRLPSGIVRAAKSAHRFERHSLGFSLIFSFPLKMRLQTSLWATKMFFFLSIEKEPPHMGGCARARSEGRAGTVSRVVDEGRARPEARVKPASLGRAERCIGTSGHVATFIFHLLGQKRRCRYAASWHPLQSQSHNLKTFP